jgi:hypothetical protein
MHRWRRCKCRSATLSVSRSIVQDDASFITPVFESIFFIWSNCQGRLLIPVNIERLRHRWKYSAARCTAPNSSRSHEPPHLDTAPSGDQSRHWRRQPLARYVEAGAHHPGPQCFTRFYRRLSSRPSRGCGCNHVLCPSPRSLLGYDPESPTRRHDLDWCYASQHESLMWVD